MTSTQRKDLPLPDDYPLFDVDDISIVFSTAQGHVADGGPYLDYYAGQCRDVPRAYKDKANHLFFHGGSLADIGLKAREGYDAARVRRAIQYLLGSFAPKHEEKEATVGFALMKWCEPL